MKILIFDYSVYVPEAREKVYVITAGYICIFLIALLFYHSILLAGVAGLLAFFLLEPYSEYKAKKRKELLLLQFKDLLYSLSASIASGRQMNSALVNAYEDLSLIYREDTPMLKELSFMARGMINNHQSEEELLSDFAKRTGLEDIRNFVDVFRACRVTGGDMERVIANASEVLMEKMAIEREIRTLTAQRQFEGRIISLMPIVVVLFLNIFSPDYLAVMYESAQGRILMSLALAGIFLAYRIMMKMTDIEV